MECPSCSASTRVLETRREQHGDAIRRRRECQDCRHRFTTSERREPEPLHVIKRDGTRQRFDPVKLQAGLVRAAHKRPVKDGDLAEIVARIARETESAGGELPSERVGEMCLEGLRELDLGAYLQFVGVYRDLSDLESVRKELSVLSKNPRKHRTIEKPVPSGTSRKLHGPTK
jgi:transcriptional repressor NrdR